MNWVDILVLVVWGLMALWGFKSGFIGMIVPLVVIILGLALSSRIAEPVGNLSGILTGLQHFTVGRIQTDIAASPLGTFMTDNFGVTIRAVKLVPGDWDEKAKGLQSGLQDGAGELKEKVEKLKQIDKSGDPEKFPPQ